MVAEARLVAVRVAGAEVAELVGAGDVRVALGLVGFVGVLEGEVGVGVTLA
jgi:hypothetical protein